jgi:hypothetical protein
MVIAACSMLVQHADTMLCGVGYLCRGSLQQQARQLRLVVLSSVQLDWNGVPSPTETSGRGRWKLELVLGQMKT